MDNNVIIIGYSGHAYEVIENCFRNNLKIEGYLEKLEKTRNPYKLKYLGFEGDLGLLQYYKNKSAIIAIGDNRIRSKIFKKNSHNEFLKLICLVDPNASVSDGVILGKGTLVNKGCCINALARIGKGVICNTAAIIEHECIIDDFCHIGPGAVLCGNVKVGQNTLIGAGSVVLPNIKIGSDVIIGANSVVTRDVKDGSKLIGNPAKTMN